MIPEEVCEPSSGHSRKRSDGPHVFPEGPIPRTVSRPDLSARRLPVVTRMSDVGLNANSEDNVELAEDGSWALEVKHDAVINSEPCVIKMMGTRAPEPYLEALRFEIDVFQRLLNLAPRLAAFFPRPVARLECEHHVGLAVERFEAFTTMAEVVAQMNEVEAPVMRRDAEDTVMVLLLQWCIAVLALRAVGQGHSGDPSDAIVVPYEGAPPLKMSTFAIARVDPSNGAVTRCAVYRFPTRYRVVICAFEPDTPLDPTPNFTSVPIRRLKHIHRATSLLTVQDILWDAGTPFRKWSLPTYSAEANDVIVVPVF